MNRLLPLLFTLSILLFPSAVIAQSQQNAIDSLFQELEKDPQGVDRIKLLNRIGIYLWYDHQPDSAINFANQALDLAEKEGYDKGKFNANYTLGRAYNLQNDHQKAKVYFENALELGKNIESENIDYFMSAVYNDLGNLHLNIGNHDRSISNFLNAIGHANVKNDSLTLQVLYNNIGNVYEHMSKFDSALFYHLASLKLTEELNDEISLMTSYNNIGNVYSGMKDYESALDYYTKSLEKAQELDNKHSIATAYENIGVVYFFLEDYQKALDYYQRSAEFWNTLNDEEGILLNKANIAVSLVRVGEVDRGEKMLREVVVDFQKNGDKYSETIFTQELGNALIRKGKYKEAEEKLFRALELAEEAESFANQRDVLKEFVNLYKSKGDYKNGLEYYEKYSAFKDSIFNEEKSKQLAEMQTLYDTEKKEKENEILKKEQAMQKAVNQRQWAIIIAIVLITVLVVSYAGFLYYRNNLKTKANKLLRKQNEEILAQKAKIQEINAELASQHEEILQQRDMLEEQNQEIALKNENLERSYQNVKLLSDMGKVVTSSLDAKSIVNAVYQQLSSLMDCSVFGVGLYQKTDEQEKIVFDEIVENGNTLPAFEFDLANTERLSVISFLQQKEIISLDYSQEYTQYTANRPSPVVGVTMESIVYLPISTAQQRLGVITLQSEKRHAYEQHHINILRNLAVYIAIALENAQAFSKLRELIEEKDNLMSVVAHDLKSPLNKISGILNLLKFAGEVTATQQEYIGMVNDIIKQGSDLIRDILDVNAFEHTESEPEMVELSLNELAKRSIGSFENVAKEKEIELITGFGSEQPIQSDKKYLGRIIENLVSNAIKFSPKGKKVWLTLKNDDKGFGIIVKDQGPGISEADQKKMFKRFQKLSARPTGNESSTGLGLSIIKTLVGRLNGTIQVNSTIGAGTSFIVQFPKTVEADPVA